VSGDRFFYYSRWHLDHHYTFIQRCHLVSHPLWNHDPNNTFLDMIPLFVIGKAARCYCRCISSNDWCKTDRHVHSTYDYEKMSWYVSQSEATTAILDEKRSPDTILGITFLAHQIQRFKWGFPVTCHQSSLNFHILILNFLSITTRTILDEILLWCSSSKIVSGDRFSSKMAVVASDWLTYQDIFS
jgi:hypothetical protein